MNQKLWGGCFAEQTNPEVEAYTASISFDQKLASEDIAGSIAHAQMLVHCGILDQSEGQLIVNGLNEILHDLNTAGIQFNVKDEDIHMNIERILTHKIGPVAGKLHTARSRNDQVALDLHLFVRKHIVIIVRQLLALQTVLLDLAALHTGTVMPGYTHLQRAQPIYLTQHLLAYVSMFDRDISRFRESWERANISPLGAAALAGTTLPIDKHHVANALKFSGIYQNTIDAVSDRDFVIEFIAHASIFMMHISRLSEELILWSSQEFNFISFDDAFSTGSSIMPQKKNPDVAELGRGKTARVYGALMTVLTLLKGLPLAYNKDLQEDKEPLFDVVNTVESTLSVYSNMMKSIVFHPSRMKNAALDGFLNATALAEYCVKEGMTFRAAHEVVGRLVAFAQKKHCHLEQLSLEELQGFIPFATDNIYSDLCIEKCIATPDHSNALSVFHHKLDNICLWLKSVEICLLP